MGVVLSIETEDGVLWWSFLSTVSNNGSCTELGINHKIPRRKYQNLELLFVKFSNDQSFELACASNTFCLFFILSKPRERRICEFTTKFKKFLGFCCLRLIKLYLWVIKLIYKLSSRLRSIIFTNVPGNFGDHKSHFHA